MYQTTYSIGHRLDVNCSFKKPPKSFLVPPEYVSQSSIILETQSIN